MKTLRFMRWGDKMNAVLHCPSVVGGNATTLSRHLNMIGCRSLCVAYEAHPFGYQADVTLWRQEMGLLRREITRVVSVFRAALGYQTIHFNFGTTMAFPSLPVARSTTTFFDYLLRRIHSTYTEVLQLMELTLLRVLRRKVLITFQGDDVRQGDLSLVYFSESIAHNTDHRYYHPLSDAAKRRRLRRLIRVASHVSYVNPDLSRFLPASAVFVPYSHTEVEDLDRTLAPRHQRPMRFLHAPSHRGAKGTDIIIAVFEQLSSEKAQVELSLIENMTQERVWDAIYDCDVLIDQLFAGWYGGIAVEALCRGRLVAAFVRKGDLDVLDPEMVDDLPVIGTSAETLAATIRDLVGMSSSELDILKSRGLKYSQKWHSPTAVARLFSSLYGCSH